MVYVGKFTGRYMEREVADFFAAARLVEPALFFLVLSQTDRGVIERELGRAGIPPSAYRVGRSEPGELGRYLAGADFGVSFVRGGPSRFSSSPTKIGEYLCAGLPVLSTPGIGDVDELLTRARVGVLIRDFSEAGYAAAAREILALAADPECAARCRQVAREELSLHDVGIPRYDRLYREVAAAA
jgi:glycosyltransferase involved in cell wall biosynthesis